MPQQHIDFLGFGYAAVVAVGGLIGYVKAGSIPSLAAGLAFGGILGAGAYMTSQDNSKVYFPLITSIALTGLMGYRFYNSGKFMPAGLVATLGALMVLRYGMMAAKN